MCVGTLSLSLYIYTAGAVDLRASDSRLLRDDAGTPRGGGLLRECVARAARELQGVDCGLLVFGSSDDGDGKSEFGVLNQPERKFI